MNYNFLHLNIFNFRLEGELLVIHFFQQHQQGLDHHYLVLPVLGCYLLEPRLLPRQDSNRQQLRLDFCSLFARQALFQQTCSVAK